MTRRIIVGMLVMVALAWGVVIAADAENKEGSDAKKEESVAAKETAAIAAAEAWLALVDDAKYGKSHDQAAELFRNAVTKAQWTQQIKGVRGPLGKLKTRKVKDQKYATSLPGAPDGEYVVIQFETSFENKAAAIETVTPMMDKDGKWRVSGYYVN